MWWLNVLCPETEKDIKTEEIWVKYGLQVIMVYIGALIVTNALCEREVLGTGHLGVWHVGTPSTAFATSLQLPGLFKKKPARVIWTKGISGYVWLGIIYFKSSGSIFLRKIEKYLCSWILKILGWHFQFHAVSTYWALPIKTQSRQRGKVESCPAEPYIFIGERKDVLRVEE